MTTGFELVVALLCCVLIMIAHLSFQTAYSTPTPTDSVFKIEKVFSAPFKPSTMTFLGKDDFLILDRDEGKVFRGQR